MRRVAVEPRESARENRKFLARVVADDANVDADRGLVGRELDLLNRHEADRLRIKAKKTKIVHGVAVERPQPHLRARRRGASEPSVKERSDAVSRFAVDGPPPC